MFALYKISANTVLQQWGNLPSEIIIEEASIIVHAPNQDWHHGDYRLIPVINQENYKHFLSEPDGTDERITRDDNGQPQLTVTFKYRDPSLETAKTTLIDMVSNNVNTKIQSLNLDYASILEVHELKTDKNPDMLDYPLLTPLITKTFGNTHIASLDDAAAYTMKQFKVAKKELANQRGFLDAKLAAINAANTVEDVLATYSDSSSAQYKYRKTRIR